MSMFVSDGNIYKLLGYSENKSTGFKEVTVLNTKNQEEGVFHYKGSVRFFNDSNGVGHTWVGYEFLKPLTTFLIDELAFNNFNDEFIEEIIAEIEYSEKLKEYENDF